MRINYFIYILTALVFCCLNLNSQNTNKKNFQILDSLIKIEAQRFAEEIAGRNIKNIEIIFNDNPATWLVKQHFYTSFKEKNINFLDEKNTTNPVLNVNIKQIELQFQIYDEYVDSLFRKAVVIIDGNLNNNQTVEIIESKNLTYGDIVARADVDFIKSDNAFANAPVPEKKKTFFEEIATPIIVVTTAILTIVILFTVRSG